MEFKEEIWKLESDSQAKKRKADDVVVIGHVRMDSQRRCCGICKQYLSLWEGKHSPLSEYNHVLCDKCHEAFTAGVKYGERYSSSNLETRQFSIIDRHNPDELYGIYPKDSSEIPEGATLTPSGEWRPTRLEHLRLMRGGHWRKDIAMLNLFYKNGNTEQHCFYARRSGLVGPTNLISYEERRQAEEEVDRVVKTADSHPEWEWYLFF